jgi:hypothetical protein
MEEISVYVLETSINFFFPPQAKRNVSFSNQILSKNARALECYFTWTGKFLPVFLRFMPSSPEPQSSPLLEISFKI